MSSDKVHVMVDIETYDIERTAKIASIGAVTMRREEQQTFYGEYSPDGQYGRTKSESTLDWWSKQPIPIPFSEVYLETGLRDFSAWLSALGGDPIIWCKGTDFDTAILAHAFTSYGYPVPWKYNNVRDMRTLKKLHPQIPYHENPQPHNALWDAINQAQHVDQIFAFNHQLTWE